MSRVQDPRRLKEKENNAEDAMRQSELDKWASQLQKTAKAARMRVRRAQESDV